MVPKCSDDHRLHDARDLLTAHGWTDPALIGLVESPSALWQLPIIAAAPGVRAMMLGPEDYAAELGVDPDGGALNVPATLLAAACAARALLPIGLPGSVANFRALDDYADKVARAKALGFRAAAAIHPAQLPIIRTGLSPSPEEIAKARQVVEVYEAAMCQGQCVAGLDGKMVDAPVVERARSILARAQPDAEL